MDCSDCHGNNNPAGPKGPHGSEFPGLLKARWNASPLATGAPDENGLCFTCHDPGVLQSGSWRWHTLHATAGFSCAACHDPHGSREFPGLLNLRGQPLGGGPGRRAGRVEPTSLDQGTCTLRCHGHPHRQIPLVGPWITGTL
jgi:predicted CXXCH cytochrome family protein